VICSKIGLEEWALLRQDLYCWFSQLLSYPDRQIRSCLLEMAELLGEVAAKFTPFSFYPSFLSLLKALQGLEGEDWSTLPQTYLRTLMPHHPGEKAVLPAESFFLPGGGSQTGYLLASLGEEYAQAGLSLTPGYPLPPDHGAVQLEFMWRLCRQEGQAWSEENLREGVIWLGKELSFLQRHPGWWFPLFTGILVHRALTPLIPRLPRPSMILSTMNST